MAGQRELFKGRRKFNRNIRTKKGMSESSTRGDPVMLPRKITFHDGITRDVLFAEKVMLSYKYKTPQMFGGNCPIANRH